MTVAVYFNDERLFRAIEVHNVWPDAMLPTKFEPPKLSGSQLCPQSSFRSGHVRTKSAFKIEIAGLSSYGSGHEPLPLLASPYKGEETAIS